MDFNKIHTQIVFFFFVKVAIGTTSYKSNSIFISEMNYVFS